MMTGNKARQAMKQGLRGLGRRCVAYPLIYVVVIGLVWLGGPIQKTLVGSPLDGPEPIEKALNAVSSVDVVVVRHREVLARRSRTGETTTTAFNNRISAELESEGMFARLGWYLTRQGTLEHQAKAFAVSRPTSGEYMLVGGYGVFDTPGLRSVCVASGYAPSKDDEWTIRERLAGTSLTTVRRVAGVETWRKLALLHESYGHCLKRQMEREPNNSFKQVYLNVRSKFGMRDFTKQFHRRFHEEIYADVAAALVFLRDGGDPAVIARLAEFRALNAAVGAMKGQNRLLHFTTPALRAVLEAWRDGSLEDALAESEPEQIHRIAKAYADATHAWMAPLQPRMMTSRHGHDSYLNGSRAFADWLDRRMRHAGLPASAAFRISDTYEDWRERWVASRRDNET